MNSIESDFLKVIADKGCGCPECKRRNATELAEKVERFMEWVETDPNVYTTADKKLWVNLYLNEPNKKYYTLSDLYSYWLLNVDKQ